jgi:hypothetical protein
LIPKYAVLKQLEVAAAPVVPKSENVARAAAVGALDVFCAQCAAWIPAERRAEFEAAREGFLAALDE